MLDKESPSFDMLNFLERLNVECLSEHDWQDIITSDGRNLPGNTLPSVASQLLARAFVEIDAAPTAENALKVMPLLQEAMHRNPRDRQNRHYMSVIYRIMGEEEKAKEYL